MGRPVGWTESRREESERSATVESPEPRNDIERLLQDMVASDNMEFSVVSSGHFFSVGLGSLARETLRSLRSRWGAGGRREG
jgi:hypothetical protein